MVVVVVVIIPFLLWQSTPQSVDLGSSLVLTVSYSGSKYLMSFVFDTFNGIDILYWEATDLLLWRIQLLIGYGFLLLVLLAISLSKSDSVYIFSFNSLSVEVFILSKLKSQRASSLINSAKESIRGPAILILNTFLMIVLTASSK